MAIFLIIKIRYPTHKKQKKQQRAKMMDVVFWKEIHVTTCYMDVSAIVFNGGYDGC